MVSMAEAFHSDRMMSQRHTPAEANFSVASKADCNDSRGEDEGGEKVQPRNETCAFQAFGIPMRKEEARHTVSPPTCVLFNIGEMAA